MGNDCDMLEINGCQPDDVQSSSLEREVGSDDSTEAMRSKDNDVLVDTQSEDARSEPTLSAPSPLIGTFRFEYEYEIEYEYEFLISNKSPPPEP